jgi:hypothetical protein
MSTYLSDSILVVPPTVKAANWDGRIASLGNSSASTLIGVSKLAEMIKRRR